MYKYNLNHIVFDIINAIVNKLLESKWRPVRPAHVTQTANHK